MKRYLIPALLVLALAGCSSAGARASSDVQHWSQGTFVVTGCVQDNGMLVQPGPEVTIKNTSTTPATITASLGFDGADLWTDESGFPQVTLQPGESEDYTLGDNAAMPADDPCDQPIEISTDP